MEFSIQHTNNPTAMYVRMNEQLASIGARAFGRHRDEFAPQVKERFEAVQQAQIMKLGKHVVGFALYDIIRSSVWRCIGTRR